MLSSTRCLMPTAARPRPAARGHPCGGGAAAATQLPRRRRGPVGTAALPEGDEGASSPLAATPAPDAAPSSTERRRAPRQADSTDAVASFLSRRFGLAGGLTWLSILTLGVLGEQIKTRLEVQSEAANTRDVELGAAQAVTTASGLKYTDLRLGGGASPQSGDLTVVQFSLTAADGALLFKTERPLVIVFGRRPLPPGLCPGVEEMLGSMRAGGRRRIQIPAGNEALGFKEGSALLPNGAAVPAGAGVSYELQLDRVSIPPS